MGSLENKSQVKRSPPFYKFFGNLKEFAFFANMGFNDAFMNFLNKGGTAPDPKDEKTAPENKENLPGKKKYIPPYTPERTPIKPEDSAKIILGNPAKKLDNSATKLDLYKESNQDQSPVWRFDSKTLLQRFNVAGKDENGDTLYKSANLFSGYIASNRTRYASVAVKFISSEGNATVVKVIQSASPDQQDGINPEIRKRSYGETSQFQENFEVYIQALISQCLDANFLDEVFNDADEYFVSNIEKVDSVTLLRKDKVMNGVSWSMRFQQALSTWPCLNDLGASAVQDAKCGVCDHEKATTMVQMFGQPYHQNTLKPVPPSEQASMNRNFSVCGKCSRLAQLYHKLYHQKHKMFTICAEVVDSRKKNSPGLDTTRMLNELLADDQWLETQFRKVQDLWADADTFVR